MSDRVANYMGKIVVVYMRRNSASAAEMSSATSPDRS
jgi:hypothetical protein